MYSDNWFNLNLNSHMSLNFQASTVERIMKNLRHEITQLRRSLEESR